MLAIATDKEEYWQHYDRLWKYSWEHFVDHLYGSWHRRKDRFNKNYFSEKTKVSLCVDPDFHQLGAFAGALSVMKKGELFGHLFKKGLPIFK